MRWLGMLLLGIILGGGRAALATEICAQVFDQYPPPLATVDEIDCLGEYAIGYSRLLRSPIWTIEHLTADEVIEADAAAQLGYNSCYFRQLPGIEDGATAEDYSGSAYDRGHMAAYRNYGVEEERKATCVYPNVVPQTAHLNRGLWRVIEEQTRELAKAYGDAYIITGPLYGATPAYLNHRIPIPAATFKVVVVKNGAWVYIASNTDESDCRMTTLARFEAERGITLVPGLDETVRRGGFMPHPVNQCHLEDVH